MVEEISCYVQDMHNTVSSALKRLRGSGKTIFDLDMDIDTIARVAYVWIYYTDITPVYTVRGDESWFYDSYNHYSDISNFRSELDMQSYRSVSIVDVDIETNYDEVLEGQQMLDEHRENSGFFKRLSRSPEPQVPELRVIITVLYLHELYEGSANQGLHC